MSELPAAAPTTSTVLATAPNGVPSTSTPTPTAQARLAKMIRQMVGAANVGAVGQDGTIPVRVCPEHLNCSGTLSRSADWSCAGGGDNTSLRGCLVEWHQLPESTPAEHREEEEQLQATEVRVPGSHEPDRFTDTWNAERLARQHGRDLRHCQAWKKWLCWDGRRWQTDDTGEAERRAKATVRSIAEEAAAEEDDKRRLALLSWAAKSEEGRRRDNMLRFARFETGIPVRPADLDRDPWLLNLVNGTLDLRSAELKAHDRGALITKLAPVAYDATATCPRWEAFLSQVMAGDQEAIGFLQRLAGYALTGDVSAEVLFFFVGAGANGKTTFLRVLQDLLGDYARSVPTDLLIGDENKGGATPERMALMGSRMAVCQETAEGKALSAANVKQITSRDKISARGLYQDASEFEPTHKLFLGTNHKPRVRSADEGTWRRLFLVPFTVTIPESERNPHLLEELRAEHAGILSWAVRGSVAWQVAGGGRLGLAAPESVLRATNHYRAAEDVLGPFLEDLCVRVPDARVDKPDLLRAYLHWADANKETPVSAWTFNTRISDLAGVSDGKSGSARYWRGIGLRDARDAQESFSETVPPRALGRTS